MMRKRSLIIAAVTLITLSLLLVFGLPAFAQTKVAAMIPGQPLAHIAAYQIITNSGLPIERLPNGDTSAVTRGRDAVNAYRYAHGQLYTKGWYRGISEDHTPLLVALVGVLEKEGYTSTKLDIKEKASEVLAKFFTASKEQSLKDKDTWK